MSNGGNISQGSLLELKAITAEHADRFAKEGRTAVRGAARKTVLDPTKARDPFLRPSPGLVKRLAREARNDAKNRHFADDGSGVSEEQRRAILEAKARKYDAIRRGDLSVLSEREREEAAIDFERLADEDAWSDHSSDVDESATVSRRRWSDHGERDKFDTLADNEKIEYVDEMGRTRMGTRKEAREAEKAKEREGWKRGREEEDEDEDSAYAQAQKSQFIHGDQHFFPVYQPDPDALKQKYLDAEREARQHHYDSTKEVRTRGAGAYQFSLDEEKRAEQMASLDAERAATATARVQAEKRGGLSAAQEAKRRRLEERKALVEAKRAKLLGGSSAVDRLRKEKRERKHEEEADKFLADVENEIRRSVSPTKH